MTRNQAWNAEAIKDSDAHVASHESTGGSHAPSSPGLASAYRQGGKKRTLVLFDFDGTLTTRDTLLEFIRFYHGRRKFWRGLFLLSPVLAAYVLKVIPNWKAKQFLLTHFFGGESLEEFNTRCVSFSTTIVPALLRKQALEKFEQHLRDGATVAVVSASAENWVKPWCDRYGIPALCTKLEVRNGVLTGKLQGRNCYGDEKACRIRAAFDLSTFDQIIAYGDSRGDREMLQLSTTPAGGGGGEL